MKTMLVLALAASAALCLSACGSASLVADTTGLVTALNNAGCDGTLTISNTVTTASLGAPAFTHKGDFTGHCGKVASPTVTAP